MKKIYKTTFFISLVLLVFLLGFLAISVVSAQNSNMPSVGIIGGADGPTAILITRSIIFDNPAIILIILLAVVLVVSSFGWFVNRKK